ncbi:MAG: response regulator [Planctomycetaceae bacterium]
MLEPDQNHDLRHEIRGLLHELSLGLQLCKHLGQVSPADADTVLTSLIERIDSVSRSSLLDDGSDANTYGDPYATVLVVEDSDRERDYLARLLRVHGVSVATASDGLEAVEFLKRHIPSAVLVDMRMPKCNGPELIEHLKGDLKFDGVSIFGLSGSTSEEAGIDDSTLAGWIQKPLDLPTLLPVMQTLQRHSDMAEAG